MLIPNIPTRSQPEKIYFDAKNVSGATITTGYAVALALGTSIDGINVVLANSTAAVSPGFIGIASKDIANNDYGTVQTGGFCGSILVSNMGTSVNFSVGDPLVPSGLNGALFSGAPTYASGGGYFVHAASNAPATLSAAAPLYVSGIIRGGIL